MKFWKYCAMFWLLMFNCSSSALSSGSLNISHHLPLSVGVLRLRGPPGSRQRRTVCGGSRLLESRRSGSRGRCVFRADAAPGSTEIEMAQTGDAIALPRAQTKCEHSVFKLPGLPAWKRADRQLPVAAAASDAACP